MKSYQDQTLDEILKLWHIWQRAQQIGSGYERKAPACGLYLGTRQYDDTNGTLDFNLDKSQCEAVDFEVEELGEPYRTALLFEARNLVVRRAVWHSPRLPVNHAQRHALIEDSRQRLIKRLVSAGVMERSRLAG